MSQMGKKAKRSQFEQDPVSALRSRGNTLAVVGTALLLCAVVGFFISLSLDTDIHPDLVSFLWWASLVAGASGGASRVGAAVLRALAVSREVETTAKGG